MNGLVSTATQQCLGNISATGSIHVFVIYISSKTVVRRVIDGRIFTTKSKTELRHTHWARHRHHRPHWDRFAFFFAAAIAFLQLSENETFLGLYLEQVMTPPRGFSLQLILGGDQY